MAVAPGAAAAPSWPDQTAVGWGASPIADPPVPLPYYDDAHIFNFDPQDAYIYGGHIGQVGWDELSSQNASNIGLDVIEGAHGAFGQTFTVPSTDHDTFPDGYPIGIGIQWNFKDLKDHSFTMECTHGESTVCPWQPPTPLGGGAKDSGANGGAHGSTGGADDGS
jgi:hypothetical protein